MAALPITNANWMLTDGPRPTFWFSGCVRNGDLLEALGQNPSLHAMAYSGKEFVERPQVSERGELKTVSFADRKDMFFVFTGQSQHRYVEVWVNTNRNVVSGFIKEVTEPTPR
ncbi:MAG: hypothetical protein GYA63_02260 [Armatimonadetes bacterium]|nr:hypothetical protein [Armatimonadota bacterium]